MAFSFRCVECGYQETTHEFYDAYDGCCSSYKSPDPKLEKELWEKDRQEEREKQRQQQKARGIPDDL